LGDLVNNDIIDLPTGWGIRRSASIAKAAKIDAVFRSAITGVAGTR
jgi:hypothetical protein